MEQIASRIDWQPVVNSLAHWLDSTVFTCMLIVFFVYCLWGRERTARWLEALGWNGIVNLVSGVWNGRGSAVTIQEDRRATDPKTTRTTDVTQPAPDQENPVMATGTGPRDN